MKVDAFYTPPQSPHIQAKFVDLGSTEGQNETMTLSESCFVLSRGRREGGDMFREYPYFRRRESHREVPRHFRNVLAEGCSIGRRRKLLQRVYISAHGQPPSARQDSCNRYRGGTAPELATQTRNSEL